MPVAAVRSSTQSAFLEHKAQPAPAQKYAVGRRKFVRLLNIGNLLNKGRKIMENIKLPEGYTYGQELGNMEKFRIAEVNDEASAKVGIG
jgi:hypothetical protein